MKNLMNKVLVVLTISAVFAGNVNAMNKSTQEAQTAVTTLIVRGATNPNLATADQPYTKEMRTQDINALKEYAKTVPAGQKGAFDASVNTLSKCAHETNDQKRKTAFSENGDARIAGAAIELCLKTTDVKKAADTLQANPTPANKAQLDAVANDAKAALANLDGAKKEAPGKNWKQYDTLRNRLIVALGTTALIAFVVSEKKGWTNIMSGYINPFLSDAYGKFGAALSGARKYIGESRVGQAAGRAGSWVGQQAASIGTATGISAAIEGARRRMNYPSAGTAAALQGIDAAGQGYANTEAKMGN